MQCPYPKPTRFSDPYNDWEGCEDRLNAILAKSGSELNLSDYQAIFQGYLPAANYEEGCYYVPEYIKYLSQTSGMEERGCEGFFLFIDRHAERFERDGLLQAVLEELWQCFEQLIRTFTVVRLSDEELERYEIADTYREIEPRSRTVAAVFEALTRSPVFDPIIARLENYFKKPRSEEASYWYLELAFHARGWLSLGAEPLERLQRVFDFFHGLDRFRSHHEVVMRSGISQDFCEYNRRLNPA